MKSIAILTLAGLASVLPAAAQDAPVAVTYNYQKTYVPLPMNEAIDAALALPGFTRQARPEPSTIVLTVPDGWRYTEFRKKDHIVFTVVFSRDGDKIGEAEELCPVAPPFDCAQQIAADVKSAAAIAAH